MWGFGPCTCSGCFYLNEPNVLPYSYFGARKGVTRLYGLSDMPDKAKMEEVAAE